ncbi:AIPR family protein [Bradyrhizobium sp. SZCCHNR1093]|uniref:AIPR family protein n=1 Tax=Bradyrhizobium sp. SZCCHNR1093 TaxID=3057368 RepID=UPI0028E72560|nr:AIPR family protein [Bradyrhizobium sp. SZCCHNR1093]
MNEGIAETAEKEPANFWYFNNGVTAICDAFAKKPFGGNQTDSGVFDVQKISVINGAQTIGSLAKAKASGVSIDNVFVHIRIISLQGTPEGFASGVTRSNNTQNDLNAADFVAFDPNQERLRREAIQLGITYAFRRGEPDPPISSGFNIRAATIAAACASGDLKLAVSAKRYISGLWDDIKKEPYTKLFNDSTTAAYLWNIVRLMTAVDAKLAEEAESLEGRERLIAVHGNRFILFCVFTQLDLEKLRQSSIDLDPIKAHCQKLALDKLKAIIPAINKKFPDAYPGNVFKNQDRQIELLAAISP